MKENQISRSALFTAYFRGYHAVHDAPKIFDDFLAWHLLGNEEREAIEAGICSGFLAVEPQRAAMFPDRGACLRWLIQRVPSPSITLARARYTEELLEEGVREGVRQYVILGAGMDTFAFRRPELLGELRIFEVDHPATQAFKRRRIAELGWEAPPNLHFVPIDFTRDSLKSALAASPFDPHLPTVFSWLGVTYYLPSETVLATLGTLAAISPAGSRVVFDYLDSDVFIQEKAAPRVHYMLKAVQEMGEPMRTGFDPFALPAEVALLGLRLREDLSPWDIQWRFFSGRTDDYRASEHSHFACAVVE